MVHGLVPRGGGVTGQQRQRTFSAISRTAAGGSTCGLTLTRFSRGQRTMRRTAISASAGGGGRGKKKKKHISDSRNTMGLMSFPWVVFLEFQLHSHCPPPSPPTPPSLPPRCRQPLPTFPSVRHGQAKRTRGTSLEPRHALGVVFSGPGSRFQLEN